MNTNMTEFGLTCGSGLSAVARGTVMHGIAASQEPRSLEGRTATVLMPQTEGTFQVGRGDHSALMTLSVDRRLVEPAYAAAATTPRLKGAVGECPRSSPA
ncbi:hypothetical protein HNR23_003311 [Nocardiopsis mwathae]|uniref:Uncharacterized protein n=1 Tax=Nocardiopsis mwathae TaxID=1472723 RepID=A0A7W9YKL3_9ACTN|nr:hypothetical protein [Nocardiopsis mwathae]MBB6173251.1 hypothetical protein [Nocardiopsis mwathae]